MHLVRMAVFSWLLVLALLLALATVYAYGKWYSHDRYWNGTIVNVQKTHALLVRDILTEIDADASLYQSSDRLTAMFSSLRSKLIVEVFQGDDLVYSNDNGRFQRGDEMQRFNSGSGHIIVLSVYAPPSWRQMFSRWIKNPHRWFESSFDPITIPFLWFFALYTLGLVSIGLVMRSSYLEKDVLAVLRTLDNKASL